MDLVQVAQVERSRARTGRFPVSPSSVAALLFKGSFILFIYFFKGSFKGTRITKGQLSLGGGEGRQQNPWRGCRQRLGKKS